MSATRHKRNTHPPVEPAVPRATAEPDPIAIEAMTSPSTLTAVSSHIQS